MIRHWRSPRVVLAILLVLGLVIRIWLSQVQWIDPDEGAHLMDGRLALNGLVPVVDFGSRQPVYVYVTALFSSLVGSSLFAMRLLPVLLSTATGYVVFRIGEILFGIREALVAATIVLLLPFSVQYSTQTKTGPLTMLLCSLAVLCFVRAERRDRPGLLLAASGLFGALAFYVRESSIAIIGLLIIAVVVRYGRSPSRLAAAGGGLLAGIALVCAALFAFYARVLPPGELLRTSLNPVQFVAKNLARAVTVVRGTESAPPATSDTLSSEPAPATTAPHAAPAAEEGRFDQPWSETLNWLSQSASLNLFLLVSGVVAGLIWLYGVMKRQATRGSPLIILLWAALLALAYAAYTVERGFFPAYFSELIPPLALLTGFVLVWALDRLAPGSQTPRNLGVIGLIALGFFLLVKLVNLPTQNQPVYFVVPTLVIAIALLSPTERFAQWAIVTSVLVIGSAAGLIVLAARLGGRPKLLLYLAVLPITWGIVLLKARTVDRWAFAALSLVLGSATAAVERQAKAVDRRYAGVWAPDALREAAKYLRAHGTPTDQAMSGAVIWEFQSGLMPFLNQSHPLGFQVGISPDLRRRMEDQFNTNPPRFIVLDGYTERTYLRHLPGLEEALSTRYTRVALIPGTPFRLQIYQLKSSGPILGNETTSAAPVASTLQFCENRTPRARKLL